MTDEETNTKRAPLAPADYLNKPATPLHERFVTWIQDAVGYDASAAKSKQQAFEDGVRIATATRMVFQASTFNREETAKARAAREAATAAAPAVEKAPAAAAAPKAAKAPKKASPTPPAATPAVAPAAPARRPARRAPAAAATVTTEEAPF